MSLLSPRHGEAAPYTLTGHQVHTEMSRVRKARDERVGDFVAIKSLPLHLRGRQDHCERMHDEYEVHALVRHRTVVRARALLECPDEGPLIVSDWVEKPTMGEWLEKRYDQRGQKKLDPSVHLRDTRIILQLLARASRGVECVHAKGFVHRDIKPGNLFVNDGAVVFDFGLACPIEHVESVHAVGTPCYMSPEAACCEPLGPETDTFGFGAVLYDALTGTPPFHTGESFQSVIRAAHVDYRPVHELNPAIPREMASVCEDVLRLDRHDRLPMPIFRRRLNLLLRKLPRR